MYLDMRIESQISVSPQVVLTSEVLQLASAGLEQRVLRELEENPALERVDSFYCVRCGAPVAEGQRLCYQCAHQAGGSDGRPGQGRQLDAWLPELITLEQHVWAQLRLLLPPSLHSLAELVVGYLDDRGFLPISDRELADRHRVPVPDVARVVNALQQVEPVGIGARDAREALLIQIQDLSRGAQSAQLQLASSILQEHWMLLNRGERVWDDIADARGVGVDAVREAVAFISRELNPFPAQAWEGETRNSPLRAGITLRPDLLLSVFPSAAGEKFEVEVLDRYRFQLRVNELYAELGRGEISGASEADVETARYYLEEARLLLHSLDQRRRTLTQVSLALAEYQKDFVLHGPRHLRPLTRAQLAEQLGVHESTISRAVAQKYIQMPDQQVIALADFFDNSLPAKHDLQVLIVQEDKARPSSDRVLATQLRGLGHDITRRTVTKYRQALGIPSSHFRHLAAQYKGLAHQSPSSPASGQVM